MALTLTTVTQAAVLETKFYNGTDEFTVAAGESLKIETSPNGDEILDEEVPAGKTWEVSVTVSIKETTA